jgi:endonuclease/exonuclease/phosphatase family metal-dependent hydrolase
VAVTHLDHMGTTARLKQAEMIAQWVRERTVPVILMGDFNDGPDSKAHKALVNEETGLSDPGKSWAIPKGRRVTPITPLRGFRKKAESTGY